MADKPKAPREGRSHAETLHDAQVVLANRAARTPVTSRHDSTEVIPVMEETATVSTRRRRTGVVRVSTSTETIDEVVATDLDRYRIEVTRVPVDRVVDEAPVARAEGDTTIIPVVEERLVVSKQFVLVEEIHVRHVLERKKVSEPVALRRQRVVVERLGPQSDPDTRWVGDDGGPAATRPSD